MLLVPKVESWCWNVMTAVSLPVWQWILLTGRWVGSWNKMWSLTSTQLRQNMFKRKLSAICPQKRYYAKLFLVVSTRMVVPTCSTQRILWRLLILLRGTLFQLVEQLQGKESSWLLTMAYPFAPWHLKNLPSVHWQRMTHGLGSPFKASQLTQCRTSSLECPTIKSPVKIKLVFMLSKVSCRISCM